MKCKHPRVSTNRGPKGTITYCKDCGEILKVKK